MSDSSIIFVELMRREREKIEKKLLFRPPNESCMNTNKEENKRLREKLREERANDDTTDKGSD